MSSDMDLKELVARHRGVVAMIDALARADGSVTVDVAEEDAGLLDLALMLGLLAGDLRRDGGRATGALATTDLFRAALDVHRGSAGCIAGLTKHLTAPAARTLDRGSP